MRLRLILASALLICGSSTFFSVYPAASGLRPGKVKGVALREVAAPLRDVWLRFHEDDLCLGVDRVFVFQARGVEIWCRIKDERKFQQLAALVEPLRTSYRIELYATREEKEKRTTPLLDDDPPPSFWTNAELRGYLRDPFSSRFGSRDDRPDDADGGGRDPELKRRLKLFGDQIVEWAHKMAQLAIDLPSLTGAGYGDEALMEIRGRARAVCSEHSREVGKYAVRLADSLSHALPRGTGSSHAGPPAKAAPAGSVSVHEGAQRIAQQAGDLERRILLFVFPRAYSVTLDDLREPGLIDSLKALQQAVADYGDSAKKTR